MLRVGPTAQSQQSCSRRSDISEHARVSNLTETTVACLLHFLRGEDGWHGTHTQCVLG